MDGDLARVLADITLSLGQVRGVAAVVLGGSRATGTHTPESDVDLGIYYAPDEPLDVEALDRLAAQLDDRHVAGLVTPVGGWGPWINGGGWLTIDGWHADLLYRDLGRVERVVEECQAGRFEFAYQPGHPHGFPSYIYMGEVSVCQPLVDLHGRLAALKERVMPYPAPLRQSVLDRFFWEADFSLRIAAKGIPRGDIAYMAGCCFRCVACLTQCLFAINGQYWLNEKGAVARAAAFERAPRQYRERTQRSFAALAGDALSQLGALDELRLLSEEVGALR